VDQGRAEAHQLPRPFDDLGDQGVRCRAVLAGEQVERVDAVAAAIRFGQVEAAAPPVDAQVLPEIGELQGGADRVGAGQALAAGDAVQMQQQPADLIVLPPGMPPVNKDIQTRRGRVRAVSPQLEVVDPTMLATMKTYPNHYRNGEAEGMNTKKGVQPKPSFLVKIPRRAGSILGGDSSLAGSAPAPGEPRQSDPFGMRQQPASDRRPAPPPAPGYGKLPSLGGN
jgi:hypothetical protein